MPYNQFGMGQQGMRPQGFGQFPQPQMGTGGFNPWQMPQQPLPQLTQQPQWGQQPQPWWMDTQGPPPPPGYGQPPIGLPPLPPGYGGVPASNPFAGGPFDPSLWDPSTGSYASMPVGYENGVPGYYQHMQFGSQFIPITGGNVPWKPGEYQTNPNPQKWDPNLPGGGFPPIGLPPLPPGQQPPGQPPIGLPPLPPGYQPPGGFVGGDWVYDPRTQNIPPDATELPPWMYPPGYQPPGQPPIGLPPLPPPGYQGDNVMNPVPGQYGQPIGGNTTLPYPTPNPAQLNIPPQYQGSMLRSGAGTTTPQKRIPKGSMYGGMERL